MSKLRNKVFLGYANKRMIFSYDYNKLSNFISNTYTLTNDSRNDMVKYS